MALATLCSQIRRFDDRFPELRNIRFQAFVVDHKARTGSTREARQVAKFLDQKLSPLLAELLWPRYSFNQHVRLE